MCPPQTQHTVVVSVRCISFFIRFTFTLLPERAPSLTPGVSARAPFLTMDLWEYEPSAHRVFRSIYDLWFAPNIAAT